MEKAELKLIKQLYKKNNKVEKQYLILRNDSDYEFVEISDSINKRAANTNRDKILKVTDTILKSQKIIIVHNHPGLFKKAKPSDMDKENQRYIENIMVSLGKNLDDYLIYSNKSIFSFKEQDLLWTGLKDRKKDIPIIMNNPYQTTDYQTLKQQQHGIDKLIGMYQEVIITKKRMIMSNSIPLEKLMEFDDEDEFIVFFNEEADDDIINKKISYYAQHCCPSDFFIRQSGSLSSLLFD